MAFTSMSKSVWSQQKQESSTTGVHPIIISGFTHLLGPEVLAKIIDKVKTGMLYAIETDKNKPGQVIVIFAQPSGMSKSLKQIKNLEIYGVRLVVNGLFDAPGVVFSEKTLVEMARYSTIRCMCLSRSHGDPMSNALKSDEFENLEGVIRITKLAPDYPTSKVCELITVEFNSIETCIAMKDKVGNDNTFKRWVVTYGKDPCGAFEKETTKPVKAKPYSTEMSRRTETKNLLTGEVLASKPTPPSFSGILSQTRSPQPVEATVTAISEASKPVTLEDLYHMSGPHEHTKPEQHMIPYTTYTGPDLINFSDSNKDSKPVTPHKAKVLNDLIDLGDSEGSMTDVKTVENITEDQDPNVKKVTDSLNKLATGSIKESVSQAASQSVSETLKAPIIVPKPKGLAKPPVKGMGLKKSIWAVKDEEDETG